MSYGGSNPPWQRSTLGAASQPNGMPALAPQLINTNLVGYPTNTATIYGQSMAIAQSPNTVTAGSMTIIPQISNMNAINANMYTQAVQYPNTRNLNQTTYMANNGPPQQTSGVLQQQQPHHQGQQCGGGGSGGGPVCSRTGVVTKYQKDYGFIDDEILFHKNMCKGMLPKIGDRVVVEATYTNASTFKWNATMVQVIGGGYGTDNNPSSANAANTSNVMVNTTNVRTQMSNNNNSNHSSNSNNNNMGSGRDRNNGTSSSSGYKSGQQISSNNSYSGGHQR